MTDGGFKATSASSSLSNVVYHGSAVECC